MDKSVGVSLGVSVGVPVGVAVATSVDVSVGDRYFAVDFAVETAMEIALEIAMASTMGLHGVPLFAAAFRGGPWNVRGSPWKVRSSPWSVRGCPWNAVDMAVECRGGPWTLPRCSTKKTNVVHPSFVQAVIFKVTAVVPTDCNRPVPSGLFMTALYSPTTVPQVNYAHTERV